MSQRPRGNGRSLGGPAFNVPVRRPVAALIHCEGKPACPTNNSGGLPSSQQRVRETICGRKVMSSAPERQIQDVVSVDLVGCVVIGYSIELVRRPGVDNLGIIV